MTSEKHTPGPWMVPHLADEKSTCNCRGVVEETYAGGIATICVSNGIKMLADGGNDCPPLEEAQANARLIAAAPDMLEALEKAEGWLKGWASAEHELQIIQTAIAKAKGLDG